MLSYILVALILLAGSHVFRKANWWKAALLILTLFSGLRSLELSGYDALYYQALFYFDAPDNISSLGSYSGDYEIGLVAIMTLCKQLGFDYLGFQIVFNVLVSLLLGIILWMLPVSSRGKGLFVFAFFCLRYLYFDWTLLRQCVAVLVSWLAFAMLFGRKGEIGKGRVITSCALIAIAFFFHSSALISALGISVLFLAESEKRAKRMAVAAAVITLVLIATPSYSFVVGIYTSLTGDTSYQSTYGTDASSANFINIALRWMFVFIAWRELKNNGKLAPFFGLAVLSATTSAIGSELAFRLAEYFSIGTYACAAISRLRFEGRERSVYDLFLSAALIVVLARYLITFSGGALLPYSLAI